MIPILARVELGVGAGDYAARMAADKGGPVWAYDLFNGTFPEHTCWDNEDMMLISAISSQCDKTALDRLTTLGVICVVGEFPGTFWKNRPESVSFVRIDMDTYVTTISALELFHPRMIPGGHFLVHDYAHGGLSGVGRAIKEFMASPTGQEYTQEIDSDHMRITKGPK